MHHPTRTVTLLALSVALLAGCNPAAPPRSGDAEVNGEAEGKMKMSMKDLVKLGRNYTCTFADVDDDGTRTDGTIYVQGETNFRGSFTMTEKNGKKSDSQMLMTNDTSYMWSADTPEGIMMRLDPEDDSLFGDAEKEEGDGAIKEDEPLELDCKKWSPNRATFTPPADRTFIDFQAQIDAMTELQKGGSSCAMCDQIPDAEGKAECRKALSC